jgi:CBS domain-containing protein
MSIQVEQLLVGKGKPVCIRKDDSVVQALNTMVEYEYSQLPVIRSEGTIDTPEGMVTYEGILRGIRNFKAKIDDLKVKDVMTSPPICRQDDDIFDILEKLKNTNAVLVIGPEGNELIGIITSYDSTEYFRTRTEDLIRVEDIERMIKDFIEWVYTGPNGEIKKTDMDHAITAIKTPSEQEKKENIDPYQKFQRLTLSEYISLLVYKKTWDFFKPIFDIPRESLIELLNKVRNIRNSLAHFRGDLAADQRETLKFCADWFSKRMEEYEASLDRADTDNETVAQLFQKADAIPAIISERSLAGEYAANALLPGDFTNYSTTDPTSGSGRYALLADWLQSQPGHTDSIHLSFNQIEEIIQADLPPSSRERRGWWANDSVSHIQSQHWLDAGWRTTYINLTEEKVTFTRIKDREKAYIAFFSKLLDELRKDKEFPCKEVSPDGVSWIIVQSIPKSGRAIGSFAFAFSRGKRMRVELYLDLYDQIKTKAVFDELHEQKERLEDQLGPIEWERLDDRRASRLAIYHDGYILNESNHSELIKWASKTMARFYAVLAGPAEETIYSFYTG